MIYVYLQILVCYWGGEGYFETFCIIIKIGKLLHSNEFLLRLIWKCRKTHVIKFLVQFDINTFEFGVQQIMRIDKFEK